MDDYLRKLGMDSAITRRDFMNGVAVTVAAAYGNKLLGQSAATQTTENYPPLRSGLRAAKQILG